MSQKFENYEASVHSPEKTGLRLFGLKDKTWGTEGTFVEFNPFFDVHAGVAYIGAKTSRSIESTEEIFQTVHEASNQKDGFSGDRLAGIFTGYGHASVADMAPVMLFFDKLPMHLAYRLFNFTSVGGGQELSTRYVKLKDFGLPTLPQIVGEEHGKVDPRDAEAWIDIQAQMANMYNKWYERLRPQLDDYLASKHTEQVKTSTLDSRTLDVVRMFLPFGAHTRQAFLGSARNWVDLASQLRSCGDPQSIAFGDMIVSLLSLEDHPDMGNIQAHLKGLTKYSEGSDVMSQKIATIKKIAETAMPANLFGASIWKNDNQSHITELTFQETEGRRYMSEGEAMLASYLGAAFPDKSGKEINAITDRLVTPSQGRQLSEVIFDAHTHHNLMRSQADIRGIPLWYESALAFHRDINRQRAMGRNALMLSTPSSASILQVGHNDNYAMREADYWNEGHDEWESDMKHLYDRINEFVHNVSAKYGQQVADTVATNIMPLGTQVNMLLSGPPSQWNYMTSLRVALGGDFGYRDDVWKMLELVRGREPLLSGMAGHLTKPDINDPEQIVGRS